ncbi:SDR family NAD(P)-dependent oxidoreductase [Sphingomonas sp. NPDC092331]|jgi:NAD(P)-dependent dehydrogenase (short-subunit alcohol dehydrogenase family)|uniref:SDR family NAD(P)-dependent oxidoreductase n=1 Tax=unclassified Sphingomonas TaxID=196159 RepID=UPI0029EDAA02|nr:SDR family oxidoreductase [Pseudomonadota bacterium]
MRLKDVHAVVTGGGSGIGAAIARALAEEGARLTLIGRRVEPIEAVAATILGAITIPVDVTDRASIDIGFETARTAHGPIGILVNNAGIAPSAPFARVTADAWRATMATNLDALFHCCQAALPDLLAAPAGRIVTIASTAGLKGYGYTAAYVASKHGAIGLMRALAAEFAATPLTANALCPGFTDTDIVARAIETIAARTGRSAAEALAELTRHNPQKRLITPEEVAAATVWLCLPASGSVTGQAIPIAGGEVT